MREDARKVLASVLGVPTSKITDESSIETVEGWDSIQQINLILALEEKFGVTFGDDDVLEMTSFRVVMERLRRLKR